MASAGAGVQGVAVAEGDMATITRGIGMARPAAPDLEGLERRLDVRRRARVDGKAEIPSSDATELGATEHDIHTAIALVVRGLEAARAEEAARLVQTLRLDGPTPIDLEGPIARAELTITRAQTAARDTFADLKRQQTETEAELAAFKRANNRLLPAQYPKSPALAAGLLMAAALFEAAFSASLFAQEQEAGLLGGAVVATGLSGANVALGVLAGFLGFRYLAHVSLLRRVAGAALALTFFGLAAGLNLYAATWRDQASEPQRLIAESKEAAKLYRQGVAPPVEARARFLNLAAPEATILLMLAAGVWVFAALKGHSGLDDPYPDYGRLDRAAVAARAALADYRVTAHAALDAPIAEAQSEIERRLAAQDQAIARQREAYEAGATRLEAWAARIRAAQAQEAGLLALYRRENEAARTTPPPVHFAGPSPAAPPLPDALAGPGEILAEAQSAMARLRDAAAKAMKTLNATYQAQVDALETTA